MSTMPDLNLNDVGIMAYWNIADEGYDPDNIDFSELTTAFDEHTVYDNGYVGEIYEQGDNHDYNNIEPSHRDHLVRVKTDGWFVVYLDDTFSTEDNTGPWDFLGWDNVSVLPQIDYENYLLHTLEELTVELNEDPSVLSENVYYYTPLSENADVLSIVSVGSDSYGDEAQTGYVSIPDTITLDEVWVASTVEDDRPHYIDNTETSERLHENDSIENKKAEVLTDAFETDAHYKIHAEGTDSGGDGNVITYIGWW